MPQEYVPKDVKEVGDPDQYGNRGYSVLFSTNDSVFMKVKDKAPEVGVPEYGEITNEPKRKDPNSTYKRFRRKQREEYQQPTLDSPTPSNFTAIQTLEKRVSDLELWRDSQPDTRSTPTPQSPDPKDHILPDDDEINIDDIPF